MEFTLSGVHEANVPTGASRWTSRIALFSLAVLLSAAFLHRLFGIPTPVAFNLVVVAYAGVALSLLMALVAGIGIWRTGAAGAARIVFGVGVSLLMLAGPLVLFALARDYPPINDVTTDVRAPPQFTRLAALRGPGANPAAYPGERFAAEQARAYPDIRPITFNRASEEAFDLVIEALKRLKMDIVREDVPSEGKPGMIEAVDRTLIAGFYDDVAIRVSEHGTGSRVDIRSASRYGWMDFGQNAERVRTIVREIVARLDATVPTAEEAAAAAPKREDVKQRKAAGQRPAVRRRPRDRAQ